MKTRTWSARFVFLSLCLSAAHVNAQVTSGTAAPVAPSDPATARARDLYSEGAKLFNEGKYEAARVSFAAAFAIKPHPENARALADCEWALQKWRDAAEHYAVFFASKPTGLEQAKVKLSQTRFDEARKKIGTVRPHIKPAAALVTVLGETRKASDLPAEMFVMPGEFKMEVSLTDHETVQKTVVVNAGDGVDVSIELKLRGATPPETAAWTPPAGLIVTSGALALAGIGVGIALGVAAQNKATEANQLDASFASDSSCFAKATDPKCKQLKDAWAAQDALSASAAGSLVAGGVFSLAASGLLIWRIGTAQTQGLQATPIVSAQGGFMSVSGKW